MTISKLIPVLACLFAAAATCGEISIATAHNANDQASAEFRFEGVPAPAQNDAASGAEFFVLDGTVDSNGGPVSVLQDGKLPGDQDQPSANFFFRPGTKGGRILVDLREPIEIKQINTYSWHPEDRGPQVYTLHASDGSAGNFNARPPREDSLEAAGWKLIAKVDSRPHAAPPGGQHAVSISDTEGVLGRFRYLLFDISPTSDTDAFAQTFYSEIDVLDLRTPPIPAFDPSRPGLIHLELEGGKYEITIDTSESADLRPWAEEQLAPVVREWYPRLVEMLPSEGHQAPKRVTIQFIEEMRGVANASGNRVRCASSWFRRNLDGEARGAVVHELVHVVQNYGWGRRRNPNPARTPGWLVEGIPDYIRWFLYEPESKGAEITRQNLARAKYDANYRITGNFLNWVVQNHGDEVIPALNAAAREARYDEGLWKEYTGKTVEELGQEWRDQIEKRLAEASEESSSSSR